MKLVSSALRTRRLYPPGDSLVVIILEADSTPGSQSDRKE